MFAARTAVLHVPGHGRLPSDRGGSAWHPGISSSPLSLCRSPRALGRALVTVPRGHSGPRCVLACSLLQATAQPSCRRLLSAAHEASRPAREQPAGPSVPPPCSPPSCPPALHIQKLPRGEATRCLVLLAKGGGPGGETGQGRKPKGARAPPPPPTRVLCPQQHRTAVPEARERSASAARPRVEGQRAAARPWAPGLRGARPAAVEWSSKRLSSDAKEGGPTSSTRALPRGAAGRSAPAGCGGPDPAVRLAPRCACVRGRGPEVVSGRRGWAGAVLASRGAELGSRGRGSGAGARLQRLAMGDPERLSLPPSLKILESVPWTSWPLRPL